MRKMLLILLMIVAGSAWAFKDCEECPEMVNIAAGIFLMGTPQLKDSLNNGNSTFDERPQHRVNIQSFALGKYPVTQEEWSVVMDNKPGESKGRKIPVIFISWNEAQLFVQKLSQKTGKKYRLPSEAEWEFAARAGSTTIYPWGNSDSELNAYAWYRANATSTNPIGLKKRNQIGLYDMLGNVWQWTQDCWNENYTDAPTDGSAWNTGDCSRRVLRGGSWLNNPPVLRTANRGWNSAAGRDNLTSLRVARSP
jgi:formylglycine-generating enzyme required for sulfatase activity